MLHRVGGECQQHQFEELYSVQKSVEFASVLHGAEGLTG